MNHEDYKLTTVYLPKDMDDQLRLIANTLSTKKDKISVSDVIRSAIAATLNELQHLDHVKLKAFFKYDIDLDELAKMDEKTVKILIEIIK